MTNEGVPPDCDHCGNFIGVASCGCGEIYQCKLLGKWCGRKEPYDEFTSFLRRELSAKNYQCCRKCEKFKPAGTTDGQT